MYGIVNCKSEWQRLVPKQYLAKLFRCTYLTVIWHHRWLNSQHKLTILCINNKFRFTKTEGDNEWSLNWVDWGQSCLNFHPKSTGKMAPPIAFYHSSSKLIMNRLFHRNARYFSSNVIRETIIPVPEVINFIERCMTCVGTKGKHAAELAAVLVAADYRGHFSHGLNRLGKGPALRMMWVHCERRL